MWFTIFRPKPRFGDTRDYWRHVMWKISDNDIEDATRHKSKGILNEKIRK